jgi:hypothetical protein
MFFLTNMHSQNLQNTVAPILVVFTLCKVLLDEVRLPRHVAYKIKGAAVFLTTFNCCHFKQEIYKYRIEQ